MLRLEQNRLKMSSLTLLLTFWSVTVGVMAGCGSGDGKVNSSGAKALRIAVIPKGTTHEFWKSVHYGAEKAAKELGNVEILWRGPVLESDTSSQIEVVKNMISKGVDGIVLAPNQKDSLVDVVQQSIDEDIPVVIFDSGLASGPKIVSYVATNNFKGGQMAANEMAKALGEKGNVILLRYATGSESTEQREEGFLDAIKNYPNIKVLSSNQFGGDSIISAKERVDQLLLSHQQELSGIFAVCESNAEGTLRALQNAGIDKQVKFIAFDSSHSLNQALKEGSCAGIVLQDPVRMGYESVKALVASIRGEAAEPLISTGEFFASPENLNDQRIQSLLKPPVAD